MKLFIVSRGGFIGVRRHHVAIPVTQLAPHAGDFVLPGATKAAIRSLPAVGYEDCRDRPVRGPPFTKAGKREH